MGTEYQEVDQQAMFGSIFLLLTLKDPVQGDQDELNILQLPACHSPVQLQHSVQDKKVRI